MDWDDDPLLWDFKFVLPLLLIIMWSISIDKLIYVLIGRLIERDVLIQKKGVMFSLLRLMPVRRCT